MGGFRWSIIRLQTVRVLAVLLQHRRLGIMKLLVLLLCCIGSTLGDSQAEASEITSASNKLSSTKSNLNSIPSAPAQKTTLIQQQQQPQSHQYVPQYVLQKQVQVPQQHQQPAAMFIIAQPNPQSNSHQSPLFQQAVQQLLSYYNNNPQAKYQLLQQQQGGQNVQQAQPSYHQQTLPSGALHVIPSPQLDSQNVQHLPTAPAGGAHQQLSNQHPQPTYIIPAQSIQTLNGINPGLLAQLTGQAPQQHVPVPVQFGQHQIVAQPFPAAQFNPAHLFAQQIPQFAQQIPAGHFALAPQFGGGLNQAHLQAQLPANFQLGSSGPAQAQFGVKQNIGAQNLNTNDYSGQTEKSQQSSSSSSYNPVYRTAYVKG